MVVVAALALADPVPSIRADVRGREVVVSADGPVGVHTGPAGLEAALQAWADGYAAAAGAGPVRPAPTAWSSWYQYLTAVTGAGRPPA